MKVITSLKQFDAWAGGVEGKNFILANGLDSDFIGYLEEVYPNGCTRTQVNDILWFEDLHDLFGVDEE